MHAQVESLTQLTNTSLTDVILVLCASGHFGVREAIAAAARQASRQMDQNPLTASTRRMGENDPLAAPACHRLTRGY